MSPTRQELFEGLENETRIRSRTRKQLLQSSKLRRRPLLVTWFLDGGIMAGLYAAGYAGAGAYWATLEGMWGDEYVVFFAAAGHAIPALVVGAYTGMLYGRGRYFFVMGPVVLVAATFYREVFLRLGGTDALGLPMWLYWAACAEALFVGGLAMLLGAWAGARMVD